MIDKRSHTFWKRVVGLKLSRQASSALCFLKEICNILSRRFVSKQTRWTYMNIPFYVLYHLPFWPTLAF